jgi:hypothetical protein
MSRKYRNLLSTAAMARVADTTQYASGDIVANSATAGSVVPIELKAPLFAGGEGRINAVRLTKSSSSVTAAAFRVHFFRAAPTVTSGDNAALAISNGVAKGYLGSVDVTIGQALGDGAFGRADATIIFETVKPETKIYALIEARGAYTPASAESFKIELELEASRD